MKRFLTVILGMSSTLLLTAYPCVKLGSAEAGRRSPSSVPSELFGSDSVLPLKLEAPFAQMRDEAKNLGSDAEEDFPRHSAVLSYQTPAGVWTKLPAQLNVRGNTSVTDCVFPKMEITFETSAAFQASPFARSKKYKIGTHCGDSSPPYKHTELDRLLSDTAVPTEAFIYRLAKSLGIETLQARYVRMHYTDTGLQKTFDRDAFLLETPKNAAERLGLEKLEADARGNFDIDFAKIPLEHIARIFFFEALVGNDDYNYPQTQLNGGFVNHIGMSGGSAFWNLKIFKAADGSKSMLIPYDFDLAAPVRAPHYDYPPELRERYDRFLKLPTDDARYAWTVLQRLRSLFPKQIRRENREFFEGRRAAILDLVNSSPLPSVSKERLMANFAGFYAGLAHFEDVPITLKKTAWYNADARDDEAACLTKGGVPAGLPMREIPGAALSTHGLKAVEAIDIFDTLTDVSTLSPCKIPGWIPGEVEMGLSID